MPSNYSEGLYGTDSNDADSDNDRVNDGREVDLGTNPLDLNDYPDIPLNPTTTIPDDVISGYDFLLIIGIISTILILIVRKYHNT